MFADVQSLVIEPSPRDSALVLPYREADAALHIVTARQRIIGSMLCASALLSAVYAIGFAMFWRGVLHGRRPNAPFERDSTLLAVILVFVELIPRAPLIYRCTALAALLTIIVSWISFEIETYRWNGLFEMDARVFLVICALKAWHTLWATRNKLAFGRCLAVDASSASCR
jgi:hypothetical protein